MGEYLDVIWDWFNGLNRQDWLMVLLGVCLVGFTFMRGLGSRKAF